MSIEMPSEEIPGVHIPIEETPELNLSFAAYDKAQITYLADCQAYYTAPTEENAAAISTSGALVASSFRRTIKTLLHSEPNADTSLKAIGSFIVGEDVKRVDFLKELTKTENFLYLSNDFEDFSEWLKGITVQADDVEEFEEGLVSIFISMLNNDASILAEHVEYTSEETPEYESAEPETKAKRIARQIGQHALDVAKISAGVSIGIWAMRRRAS